MPIMHARYGRPKGSGVDDSQKLESIAALLAANPGLKPTTAIRSLGIDNPSIIRRLRDKFRADQARLLANANRNSRSNGQNISAAHLARAACSHPRMPLGTRALTAQPIPAAPIALPVETVAAEPAHALPQPPLLAITCDLGLWAVQAATEQHAVLAQHWLQLPAVASVLRAQLAVGAFIIAATTPRKPLKPLLH